MDKSNVIVYAEGLAKKRNLSDKQKNELIETLTEATSILNGDKDRIEEALTFLDDKIQNSYKQFFTDTGIVATEIRSTTMIKVEKIIKEVAQNKIAQERADRQAENPNGMLNSYMDKARNMNMEVKESDLFNLPKAEVVAGMKRSFKKYFKELDLPDEFVDEVTDSMYESRKKQCEIDARVAAGEKLEDVEAEVFQDEESKIEHDAFIEIQDEMDIDEAAEKENEIFQLAKKRNLSVEDATIEYFKGKPQEEYTRYMLAQGKLQQSRIEAYQEVTNGEKQNSRTESKGNTGEKCDKFKKFILQKQEKIDYMARRLHEQRDDVSSESYSALKHAYNAEVVKLMFYRKMYDLQRVKTAQRVEKTRAEVKLYLENKEKVEELMESGFTIEAATSRVFGKDHKSSVIYMRIDRALSGYERSEQNEGISKAISQKFKGLGKIDVAIYVANQNNINEMDKKIAELEGYLANSRLNGNSKNIAMFEKQIAMYREKRDKSLSTINELEEKSNNITGENTNRTENSGQTRGTSQLVVEEISTGGENKKSKPFGLFKGLFGKKRTIQAGIKSAYDDLAVAQTAIKSQETETELQSSQIQDNQTINRNNNQQPKQGDKGAQDEQIL